MFSLVGTPRDKFSHDEAHLLNTFGIFILLKAKLIVYFVGLAFFAISRVI